MKKIILCFLLIFFFSAFALAQNDVKKLDIYESTDEKNQINNNISNEDTKELLIKILENIKEEELGDDEIEVTIEKEKQTGLLLKSKDNKFKKKQIYDDRGVQKNGIILQFAGGSFASGGYGIYIAKNLRLDLLAGLGLGRHEYIDYWDFESYYEETIALGLFIKSNYYFKLSKLINPYAGLAFSISTTFADFLGKVYSGAGTNFGVQFNFLSWLNFYIEGGIYLGFKEVNLAGKLGSGFKFSF